jgi:hypothetical protein
LTPDDVRRRFPHLGFAIYALEPGKPVTVEVLTQDGSLFSHTATTAEAALLAIFGPEPEPQKQEDEDVFS